MIAAGHRTVRLWTAEEVIEMLRAGILGEDERLELIEGELCAMSPKSSEHEVATALMHDALNDAYGEGFHARQESSLRCERRSLPEPDVSVVRGSVRDYARRHPSGDDAALVVEVAWSSLDADHAKATLYARAGVPEYWILDLDAGRLEVHRDPSPDGTYSRVDLLGPGDEVQPPGTAARILVRDVLP